MMMMENNDNQQHIISIVRILKDLFRNKLISTENDRLPIIQFTTHDIPYLKYFIGDGDFILYNPNFEIWYQLILLLLIEIFVQVIFAIIIYYTVVKQRGTTMSSYLIGWGILIPIGLYFPYQLLELLQVENLVIRMAFATPGIMIFFRCIEAMYGTAPHTVEKNIMNYCIYYTTLLHFDWDIQTSTRRKMTFYDFFTKRIYKVFQLTMFLSIMCSFMIHYKFRPFPSSVVYTSYHIQQIQDLFSIGHLLNSYCCAILIFLTLNFGFTLTSISDEMKGLYYTKPTFLNPLFTSTSPTDFWGRKWNLMIHRLLKHGVFLPSKKIFHNSTVSVLLTFTMSGLLHEYTNSVMFYHYHHTRNVETGLCETCYIYNYGKLMAFFMWNGIIMLLEKPVCKYILPKEGLNVPIPIISTFCVMTALPVAHWYYGDWVAGEYFHHLSIGLWTLEKVS